MARILLANDNADLLEFCQFLLAHDGHVVETLMNGARVPELARTWRPDLVLLDWVGPSVRTCLVRSTCQGLGGTLSVSWPVLVDESLCGEVVIEPAKKRLDCRCRGREKADEP